MTICGESECSLQPLSGLPAPSAQAGEPPPSPSCGGGAGERVWLAGKLRQGQEQRGRGADVMISHSGLPPSAPGPRRPRSTSPRPSPHRAALPAAACPGAWGPSSPAPLWVSWLSPSCEPSTPGPSRRAERCSGPSGAVRLPRSSPGHRPPPRPSLPPRSRRTGARDCHVREKHRPPRPLLQRRQGEEACVGKREPTPFPSRLVAASASEAPPGRGPAPGRGAGDAPVRWVR